MEGGAFSDPVAEALVMSRRSRVGAGHFQLISPDGDQTLLRPPTIGAQMPLEVTTAG